MKALAALFAVSAILGPGVAMACGAHSPAVQSKMDAAELTELRAQASAAARNADQIFIGTVTALSRPVWQSGDFGSVTFNVATTIKGKPASSITVRWKDRFIYSCQPSQMFYNVGFRADGTFIVYVQDGQVLRSGAADHLRSGLLSLDQERAIAASGGGS